MFFLKKIINITSLKSSSLYLFANIFNGILPLLLLPVFTSYLTPMEYGIVAIFQLTIAGLNSLVGMSFVLAADRKFFDDDLNFSNYVSSCMQLILLSCIFVCFVCYLNVDRIGYDLGLEPNFVLLAILVSFSSVVIQLRLGQWQVRQMPKYYSFFQVAFSIATNLIAVYLVAGVVLGADGRLFSLIIGNFLFGLLACYSLYRDGILKLFIFDFSCWKEIAKFSFPLLPHLIGVFLLTVFDRYIIKLNLGLDVVGVYMVGFQLMSCIGLFADAVNKVVAPLQMRSYKENNDAKNKKIIRLIYLWFILLLFVALVASIVGFYFIDTFLSVEYQEAKEILFFLALGHVFNGVYLVILNNIYYAKKTKYLSLSTIAVSFVHLTLFYIFTLNYGMLGASISFAISMLFRLVLTFLFAQRAHNMPWLLTTPK